MKTYKSILILLIAVLIAYITCFSQTKTQSLYLKTNDPASIPTSINSEVIPYIIDIEDKMIKEVLIKYNVYEFVKSDPGAEHPFLQNAYRLSCYCDIDDLIKELEKKASDFYTHISKIVE